jgi:cellulose biosynthesis protein BcsQ
LGTFRALREAERRRDEQRGMAPTSLPRPRVVVVANPKGGVGKTTLVANLAVYLRALREELPVLVLGLDGQDGLDRSLAIEPAAPPLGILEALRAGTLAGAARIGQFGVEYVASAPSRESLGEALGGSRGLAPLLAGREGLVLVDTGSDLGAPTRAALAQADLVILPVRDLESLREAEKLLGLGVPRERVRFALCGLDLRVKFDAPDRRDVLALLLYELRVRQHRHFATCVSRSAAVEALATTPDGRRRTVLHGAPQSIVHRQLRALASELLAELDALPAAAPAPLRVPAHVEPAPEGGLARWILARSGR